MKITEFFEHQYRPKKLRSRTANTVRLYRSSIRNLEKTLGRTAVIDDLTDANVERLMGDIIQRGGSPCTANKERAQLLAIWRFACQIGLLRLWPTVMPEKVPERVPQAWLIEDVQQLFASVDTIPGHIGAAPAALWWKVLLSIALDTGERIGAIMQIEWDWIDRGWCLVRAEARKGGRRDRRYLLSPDTTELLSKLRRFANGQKAVLYWPYDRRYIWSRYAKVLRDAGLPSGRKDKFHRLRKTVASVVYAAGLDAQDVLDHQHRRTTQQYLDPRFARQQQASQVLAAWLRTPPQAGRVLPGGSAHGA